MPGGQQGRGLDRVKLFDAEWAGQGEQDAVAPGIERGAPGHVVRGRVHRVGRFAGQVQRPSVQAGALASRPQGIDELGGPQVLVHIDGRGYMHVHLQ